jgi:hypothetical protein
MNNTILYALLVCYCMFGTALVNKYLFDNELFGARLGLCMAMIFMSAYPIFGWKRDAAEGRSSRRSLSAWVVCGGGIWLVVTIVDGLSGAVVRHYSNG